jgi:hypothetical protein
MLQRGAVENAPVAVADVMTDLADCLRENSVRAGAAGVALGGREYCCEQLAKER